MGRNLILLFLIIFSKVWNVNAQNYVLLKDKCFGTGAGDENPEIILLDDSSLIVAGSTRSESIDGDKTAISCSNDMDGWIIRLDKDFNLIWDKTFGGNYTDEVSFISHTSRNTIFVSYDSKSDSSCQKSENIRDTSGRILDYWITELDTSGNLLYEKTWGGTMGDSDPIIKEFPSGNKIIVGASGSVNPGADKTGTNYGSGDFWVIKVDALGNKLWDKVFGGNNNELLRAGGGVVESSGDLIIFDDESFIIVGSTISNQGNDLSQPNFGGLSDMDIWLIKIDSLGNKIWDKRLGGTFTDNAGSKCFKTTDGLMIIGVTQSPQSGEVSQPTLGGRDVWVIKLDSNGNKIWDRRYGGTGTDYGVQILGSSDGGYWIGAFTNSPMGNHISEPPYGLYDYWVFKIDSLGNKLWDKRFGGPGLNTLKGMVQMPDNSIVLCGTAFYGTSAVKTDPGKGNFDYWLVHFAYDPPPSGMASSLAYPSNFFVYPNPTLGIFTITIQGKNSFDFIKIYDLQGREVYHQLLNHSLSKIDVNLQNQISEGIYICRLVGKQASLSKKLVITQ